MGKMRRILLFLAVFAVFWASNPVSARIDDPIPSMPLRQAERLFNMTQMSPPPPPAPIRPDFDGSSFNGVCVGAIPLLRWYSPGWNVNHMAGIMYRESKCLPWVTWPDPKVSTATGLLQLLQRTHCPWISDHFRVNCTTQWLQDPHNNIMAAAELYRRQGIDAWGQTR